MLLAQSFRDDIIYHSITRISRKSNVSYITHIDVYLHIIPRSTALLLTWVLSFLFLAFLDRLSLYFIRVFGFNFWFQCKYQDGRIALRFRDPRGDWGNVQFHSKSKLDAYVDITDDTALRDRSNLKQVDINRLRSRAIGSEVRKNDLNERPSGISVPLFVYYNMGIWHHIPTCVVSGSILNKYNIQLVNLHLTRKVSPHYDTWLLSTTMKLDIF